MRYQGQQVGVHSFCFAYADATGALVARASASRGSRTPPTTLLFVSLALSV